MVELTCRIRVELYLLPTYDRHRGFFSKKIIIDSKKIEVHYNDDLDSDKF